MWIVFQPAVYLLPRLILNICLLESILKTTSVNLPALVILMALALVVSYSLLAVALVGFNLRICQLCRVRPVRIWQERQLCQFGQAGWEKRLGQNSG